MAQLEGFPQETYTGMERIRETALLRFNSLFTPERKLWTQQHLRRFHALFVERLDEGKESFLDKFRRQLEGADDDVIQLAAELLYVQQFFTSLAGPDNKIENVRVVLGWCAHPVPVPEWAIAGVKRGLAGDMAFNLHRPFHLAWLTRFLIHWHDLAEGQRVQLLKDPWRFAEDVRSVASTGERTNRCEKHGCTWFSRMSSRTFRRDKTKNSFATRSSIGFGRDRRTISTRICWRFANALQPRWARAFTSTVRRSSNNGG